MPEQNPLLDVGFEIPFERIDADHVVPAVEALVADAERSLDAIRGATGEPTWDTTFGALDGAAEPLERAWGVVEHLRSVRHADDLTAAHATALPTVSQFFSGVPLDERLYARLRAFAESPAAHALPPDRARYVERTLDEFRRHGADLAPAEKARFVQIATELAELGSRFATNVVKDTAAWEHHVTDVALLAGLPESALSMLRAQAQAKGLDGWLLTLQAPVVQAVLTYADDNGLRERVWRANALRCTSGDTDNAPLVARMVALRKEQAALLGYPDFADWVLAPRMAKDAGTATRFLDDVERRCRAAFEQETEDLKAFARDLVGDARLDPWDVAWLAEKQRKALYDLDEEELRPYFPFPSVLRGVFELVHRLYGVTVRPTELPVWHPSVEAYEAVDEDGTRIGAFYVDMFPRADKRQGAWMNHLVTGGPRPDGFAPHLGLICGNLTPPVDGRPALLTHREVETIFHEFGHLLHQLLSRVELRGQAGTNVAWDFVELPSQIMENWTWDRDALDLFARHWQTGDRIPDDLYARMIRARNFRAGSFFVRQLGFGQTDLALHVRYDPASDGDAVAWGDHILARYTPAPPPPGHTVLPTFLHLFSGPVGYAAGYYSYMWASVLEADAFSRFQQAGVFDRATGRAFREAVLSRGDSEDPGVLVRRFLGRDPDPEAMLRRAGLA
jgi:oligopeptidase A